jgi:hypothetical protein
MQSDAVSANLKFRQGHYDSAILDCALRCLASLANDTKSVQKRIRSVSVAELEVGQLLLSDVVTGSGALVITSGNRISESLLVRIRNFARLQNIRQPIKIETMN